MKICPFCAEEIQDEAVKCKHCGSPQPVNDGLDDVREMAHRNRVRAIQLYRDKTKAGLTEAKDFVDSVAPPVRTSGWWPALVGSTIIAAAIVYTFGSRQEPTVESPVISTNTPIAAPTAIVAPPMEISRQPTRSDIIQARRKYQVTVLRFDASEPIGSEAPYADYVRLRVTNGSELTLPVLTLFTTRFDRSGKRLTITRAPRLPVRDLLPGQTAEVDYYPLGHVMLWDVTTAKITVEVEALLRPEDEQNIEELRGAVGP